MVRLIGADGEQIGVVSIAEAIKAAQEAKLDLVEIAPDADPVVCKILDYGKRIFEAKKEKIIKDKLKTNPAFRKKLDALLDVWADK